MKKLIRLFVSITSAVLLFCGMTIAERRASTGPKNTALSTAPDFTLMDLEGKKVSLTDFKGKPVLIIFWARWCPYCREEIKEIKTLCQEVNVVCDDYRKKGLIVLGINIMESRIKVTSFIKSQSIKYKVLLDLDGNVAELYNIQGIPTSVLIDEKGIIRYLDNPLPEKPLIDKILLEYTDTN